MPASPAISPGHLLSPASWGVAKEMPQGGWVWRGLMNILLPLAGSSGGNHLSNEADMGRAEGRDSVVTLIQGRLPDPPLRP